MSAIQEAHRAIVEDTTSHMGVAGPIGKAVETLHLGCWVTRVQGGEERGLEWVIVSCITPSRWKTSGGEIARGAKR